MARLTNGEQCYRGLGIANLFVCSKEEEYLGRHSGISTWIWMGETDQRLPGSAVFGALVIPLAAWDGYKQLLQKAQSTSQQSS